MTLVSTSRSENGYNIQALWNAFSKTVRIR